MYFEKNSHYGKQTFWEKRYAENSTEFDWYQNWENLRDIVSQFIKKDSKILNVGAGNSPLAQDMYEEGYRKITSTDFSEIVVEDMQLKYKSKNYSPEFKFELSDVRSMRSLADETFDCVIDKGLLDSVLCGAYSKQNSKKMLKEISRVLKTKGFYICISYGDPDIRNHLFEDKLYQWSKLTNSPYKVFKPNIEQSERDIVFDDKDKEKNKDYYHYVYIMQKNIDLIQNPLDSQVKSSNIAINSFNR